MLAMASYDVSKTGTGLGSGFGSGFGSGSTGASFGAHDSTPKSNDIKAKDIRIFK
jgi:hypothetical protein